MRVVLEFAQEEGLEGEGLGQDGCNDSIHRHSHLLAQCVVRLSVAILAQ